ncbi:hypothetical protein BDW67DRAFT_156189 [Aspergillus spinulosporus]
MSTAYYLFLIKISTMDSISKYRMWIELGYLFDQLSHDFAALAIRPLRREWTSRRHRKEY